jgi:hypothetical protein
MQVANPWRRHVQCAPISVQLGADHGCLPESFLRSGIIAAASELIETNSGAARHALAAAMSPLVAATRSAYEPRRRRWTHRDSPEIGVRAMDSAGSRGQPAGACGPPGGVNATWSSGILYHGARQHYERSSVCVRARTL